MSEQPKATAAATPQAIDWQTILQLIISVGLPAAIAIISKVFGGVPFTPADLVFLEGLTERKSEDRMAKVLADNAIDPNSDLGKALLAYSRA